MYTINYSDGNHREAINFDGTNYYNDPMTINIDGKLFILGIGTSDSKTCKEVDGLFYIVAENTGLNYISLTVIDTARDTVEEAYLSGNDLDDPDAYSYGLLEKDTDQQIKILAEYL